MESAFSRETDSSLLSFKLASVVDLSLRSSAEGLSVGTAFKACVQDTTLLQPLEITPNFRPARLAKEKFVDLLSHCKSGPAFRVGWIG